MIQPSGIKSKYFVVHLCALVIIASYSFCSFAFAAEQVDEEKPTVFELAVFGFFRAADKAPDYERWIKSYSNYQTLDEFQQKKYLLNETLRLGRLFSNYNQEEDLLEINTDVMALLKPPEGEENPSFSFRFPEDTKEMPFNPVFAFSYSDDIIALRVKELSFFSDMQLTESQYERMYDKVEYYNEEFPVKLYLEIKPHSTDYDNPTILDQDRGIKQWMVIGKIGYIKCFYEDLYQGQDIQLWDYIAPWYKEIYERKKMEKENPEAQYPHPYDLFKD